jgi:hypothetical protein
MTNRKNTATSASAGSQSAIAEVEARGPLRLFCPKCGERMRKVFDRGAYQYWECVVSVGPGHNYRRVMQPANIHTVDLLGCS